MSTDWQNKFGLGEYQVAEDGLVIHKEGRKKKKAPLFYYVPKQWADVAFLFCVARHRSGLPLSYIGKPIYAAKTGRTPLSLWALPLLVGGPLPAVLA
jgi:hypothetical protein